MNAEILCVGSELLLGQIIDTNAAFIAGELSRIGVNLHRKQTAGDNLERIADCICGALSRADLLIITGGLGPTTDDLTREAIALALGVLPGDASAGWVYKTRYRWDHHSRRFVNYSERCWEPDYRDHRHGHGGYGDPYRDPYRGRGGHDHRHGDHKSGPWWGPFGR